MPLITTAITIRADTLPGLSVDLGTFSFNRSFTATGPFTGVIILQGSNDNVNFADIFGANFSDGQKVTTIITGCRFIRARRANFTTPAVPVLRVVANLADLTTTASLNVPAGDGVGAALSVSSGDFHTLVVTGVDPNEILSVEGSLDSGVTWSGVDDFGRFASGGDVKSFNKPITHLRVRRLRVNTAALPVVAVATTVTGNIFIVEPISWFRQAELDGAARTGLASGTYFPIIDQASVKTTEKWTVGHSSGGNTSHVNTIPGGATDLLSGALANGTSLLLLGESGGSPSAFPGYFGGAGNSWYVKVRFAAITTIDALADVAFVMRASLGGLFRLFIGVRGPVSITNYVLDVGGVTVASSIPIDLNMHTYEVWSDGVSTFMSVDDETPVSVAAVIASVCTHGLTSDNGGTLAARTMRYRRMFSMAAE